MAWQIDSSDRETVAEILFEKTQVCRLKIGFKVFIFCLSLFRCIDFFFCCFFFLWLILLLQFSILYLKLFDHKVLITTAADDMIFFLFGGREVGIFQRKYGSAFHVNHLLGRWS